MSFQVRRSARRTSVQITVDRGGELLLSAPESCSPRVMENFVREKRLWIYTKLAEKEALRSDAPQKRYIDGEGFPYLGRSYRLLLVDAQSDPVKLEHGRFKMRRLCAAQGRRHMVQWYGEHAQPWLEKRIERLRRRIGVGATSVAVSDLGFRWGSCGRGGRLNFHWRSILLPPALVEYVAAHEAIHLLHPHHGPSFWRALGRVLPDYEQRRARLRELGPSLIW
ncbi:MAG TPA: SprT family zinc-dependent metalloprotease [Polyangiaceae bacterium]|jgi:hypothetical protein|nr:SprT family zinc-dependent metalloprotease [Polyangiaceae bacterium]